MTTPEAMAFATPSKAALAVQRDVNLAWPKRKRVPALEGIMGDPKHQERCRKDPSRCEGHVLGNAVDVTHDDGPNGPAGWRIAEMAINDARTAYVISDGKIWSRNRSAEGWRAYTGPNPHTAHVHISIRPELRDNDGPWPWVAAGPISASAAQGFNLVKAILTPGKIVGAVLGGLIAAIGAKK